ncbi:hypothetical protein HPB48_003942 [Haemaphysalis longicornis]|uniref:ABC transporter n=1 Tax=Haemaphysalis longicornis TaxID=44386 RepID=A0A9J6FE07_HAELO|nr:hypothetical protein HPB48_003942 [Haemaphysalis longicornis]
MQTCQLQLFLNYISHDAFQVTTMSPGSKAGYPAGYITSLIGVDCWVLGNMALVIFAPFFGLAFLPFLFWMLAARAGVGPSLCCAAGLIVVLSLPFWSSVLQKRLWSHAIKARDERLKATTDLLSTIRVVKMYAWEDALQENVVRARETQLKWLFRINLLDSCLDSIYSAGSSLLMIILFATMPLLEPDISLTPSLAFSCVSLIYMTELTWNTCGQAIRTFGQAVISDIELEVAPGSLVGVVGFVGSGKSSLLAAILGDMYVTKGNITCSGRVAFVPQLPNVHNMTLRDNILYGKRMDPRKYERVLRSCQLMNDINKFQSGDMTEIGEKGTNLSGGQKQRISLARAVYSHSDVYLLDDPLSALDAVVGSRVFREVIGNQGLLKNKVKRSEVTDLSYSTTPLLLRLLGGVLLAVTAKWVSRSLHNDMLSHVLRSPVSFFDASPRGRVLNRFSADIDAMDANTFLSAKQCVQNALITFAKIAVIGTQSPVVVGITALVTLLAFFGMVSCAICLARVSCWDDGW